MATAVERYCGSRLGELDKDRRDTGESAVMAEPETRQVERLILDMLAPGAFDVAGRAARSIGVCRVPVASAAASEYQAIPAAPVLRLTGP